MCALIKTIVGVQGTERGSDEANEDIRESNHPGAVSTRASTDSNSRQTVTSHPKVVRVVIPVVVTAWCMFDVCVLNRHMLLMKMIMVMVIMMLKPIRSRAVLCSASPLCFAFTGLLL